MVLICTKIENFYTFNLENLNNITMHIHYISEENSILNHFLTQLRDVNIQKDSMRFRKHRTYW